jgi:hypothetical protein
MKVNCQQILITSDKILQAVPIVSSVLTPDPYTQVIIDLLQVTYLVIFYNPSKSFAIQVPHPIYDL